MEVIKGPVKKQPKLPPPKKKKPRKDKSYEERKQELREEYERGPIDRPLQKWERQQIGRWEKEYGKKEIRKQEKIEGLTREEILVSGLHRFPSEKARVGMYKTLSGEQRKPKGTREYIGKGKDISGFGFVQQPDFEEKTEPKIYSKNYLLNIEAEAGIEAGLTTPTVTFGRIEAIRQQQQMEWEAWAAHQRRMDIYPHARAISRGMSTFLGGIPNLDYIMASIRGDTKRQEEIIRGWEYGVWRAGYRGYGKEDPFARITTAFTTAAPTQYVLAPMVTGYGLGAGMGVLRAAYPTAGKIAQIGIAGYGGFKTGERLLTSKDPYKDLLGIGITLPSVLVGYRGGYRFGYGRTEAYLYKIHTYQPGSPEWIRFEQSLKIGRLLERVGSIKQKPLDFTKDIMRMDKQTASQLLNFLKAQPKTTIGGSAASYTQVIGARQPRDIDILVRKWSDFLTGDKQTAGAAKGFFSRIRTPSGKHLIDIHGREMYYPGKYHRFGFVSQRPVKIGDYRYFTGGEQLFRKGVASVVKESSYRWFKDFPDFITHARSQIISAKSGLFISWSICSILKSYDKTSYT